MNTESEGRVMTRHIPTNIIVNEIMKNRKIKHLFGRYFWDCKYKVFLIGDKKFQKSIDK